MWRYRQNKNMCFWLEWQDLYWEYAVRISGWRSIYSTLEFFLEQYNRLEIVYEEYFWYLIKNRGVFLLILTAAAGTRYRKSAVILTVIWLGFCVGMVICTAIARLGIKGIVLCVIAVMPQGVFYILSGILLFEYMLEYPVVRWNSGKTIKLIMLVLLGMITECYVNPVIIRMFLKTL